MKTQLNDYGYFKFISFFPDGPMGIRREEFEIGWLNWFSAFFLLVRITVEHTG